MADAACATQTPAETATNEAPPRAAAPAQTARLQREPTVHAAAEVVRCQLGAYTEVGPHWRLQDSSLGDYSYCAGHGGTVIYTEVGRFANLASGVAVNPGNHPVERVTQHHCTYRRRMYGFAENDDEAFFAWRRGHRCVIGHDTWMGWGASVMAGVTIGTGAVIGAGSVVTHDVPPYAVAVGVPARVIRKRFADDVIAALLQIAWWDWDRDTLEARFDDLSSTDVREFVNKYKHGIKAEKHAAPESGQARRPGGV